MSLNGRPHTAVVLAAKSFDKAFCRLEGIFTPEQRAKLAESLYLDTLEALSKLESSVQVRVVTGEATATEPATDAGFMALWLPEEESHSADVSFALTDCESVGFKAALVLPYDCPLIDPAEIDNLLEKLDTDDTDLAVITDRHGTGTNGLYLRPPTAILPGYGEGSADRHIKLAEEKGLKAKKIEVPSLALDLDTKEDLAVIRDALTKDRSLTANSREMLLSARGN